MTIIIAVILALASTGNIYADKESNSMIDSEQTEQQLRDHLRALTVAIGERSV